jgi:hypothetical protein
MGLILSDNGDIKELPDVEKKAVAKDQADNPARGSFRFLAGLFHNVKACSVLSEPFTVCQSAQRWRKVAFNQTDSQPPSQLSRNPACLGAWTARAANDDP